MKFTNFIRTKKIENDCEYTYKIHEITIDGEKIEIVENQKNYSLGIRSKKKFSSEEQDEIYNEIFKRL